MDSKIKKLVTGVALVGALTVGSAGVAVAADGSGGTTTPSGPAAQRVRHPGLRIKVRQAAVKVITDTLGVSRQELRSALQGGQTISQYATSLGKDPQTVADALTSAAGTKLDELVADGTIKEARAEAVKSRLPARIDKLMNRQFGQHARA